MLQLLRSESHVHMLAESSLRLILRDDCFVRVTSEEYKNCPVDHAYHIQFFEWLQHYLIICSRVRPNLYMVALKHKQFCLCRSNIQSK